MSDREKTAERITREIATGLMNMYAQSERLQFTVPYLVALQRGFENLTWFGQQAGEVTPQSVVDLVKLCTIPFTEWRVFTGLSLPEWSDGGPLLSWGMPTSYCQELQCSNPNVADELQQNEFFSTMIDDCKTRQDQQSYVAFRQLLIEHPIIESRDLLARIADFPSAIMRSLLRDSYEPIPVTLSQQYQLNLCASCGYVRQFLADGNTVCESEVCRIHHSNMPPTALPYSDTLLRLKRPFRRYITYPGLAELRLADKLAKSGSLVQLWPHFDRYDLHLTLPDGTNWAIDVKDWANPFLLGDAIAKDSVSLSAAYSRFLFVIPNHRLVFCSDYVRAVKSRCQNLSGYVDVVSERQFMRQVKKHLTGQ